MINGNRTYPEVSTVATAHFLDIFHYTEGVHLLPSNTDVVQKYKSTLIYWKVRIEK